MTGIARLLNKEEASQNLRSLHLGYRAVLAPGSGT